MLRTSSRFRAFTLVVLGFCVCAPLTAGPAGEPFADIGETRLSRTDYETALRQTIRSRYYHGTIPEGELARVREEVAENLINRTLLLEEAERRDIEADEAAIQATLDMYDRRYAGNPTWQQQRETMLAKLAADLGDEERLRRLEDSVRRVAPPTRRQLETYYDARPDEFTEPARIRASLILLRVAPSAPGTAWAAALAEAELLVAELNEGADFTELARLHSADDSAPRGGDMGYLHEGMLGGTAQLALDSLAPGEHSAPVRVLEGVAVLQLTERTDPTLKGFVDVRQRAQELWLRERGERAWGELIERLRSATTITVFSLPDAARGI